ncbi:MarR family winged helix-turn-helix transcriptional regulator [Massilia sp. Root418]|uniref:MarR family winged helix-turn-helix transcriptional regulator n=1 Tax=Massilia sp. Root418 TaxID=1736532 RepID=UPI0009EBF4D1|nr:MarR family transcriptional regulator [Massilia sp. Root418]
MTRKTPATPAPQHTDSAHAAQAGHAAHAAHAPQTAQVFDLESRLTQDHHQSLKLWLRMLSCTTMIESEIRTRLRNEFGITLPRFDLMAQLQRHPEGLRMGELSKRMMVTGGNVTGITDQLEHEKLVLRVPDPKDRRAYSVKLTAAGRRSFERMAQVHEGWIAELLDGLSVKEKNDMIALLSRMKGHLSDGHHQDE